MAKQQGNVLTAIDVGSAKTCALMAEVTDSGLRYRGHGVAQSRGSRKGVIVELEKAVAAIQKAVEAAEDVAGAAVEHAIVGIGGSHVRGINSHGGITLGTRPREIGRDEIKQASIGIGGTLSDKAPAVACFHFERDAYALSGAAERGVEDVRGDGCVHFVSSSAVSRDAVG